MAERIIKEAARFCIVKDSGCKGALTEQGILSAVASDATKDRDGEIIEPFAFEKHLDDYRTKDPVILSTHMHRSADARPTIVGRAESIAYKDNQLQFDMTFAPTALGQEWKTLYDNRYAKSFSVGFIPIKGEVRKDASGEGAYHHTEAELIEISTVPVGSNRNALARGLDENIKEYIKSQFSGIIDAQERLFDELKELFAPLLVRQDDAYERLMEPDNDQIMDKLEELAALFKSR